MLRKRQRATTVRSNVSSCTFTITLKCGMLYTFKGTNNKDADQTALVCRQVCAVGARFSRAMQCTSMEITNYQLYTLVCLTLKYLRAPQTIEQFQQQNNACIITRTNATTVSNTFLDLPLIEVHSQICLQPAGVSSVTKPSPPLQTTSQWSRPAEINDKSSEDRSKKCHLLFLY